jgi:hypothetical protein
MALLEGDIAVSDGYRDGVVGIDHRTRRIVCQYGRADVPGTAPGCPNAAHGTDFIPAVPGLLADVPGSPILR